MAEPSVAWDRLSPEAQASLGWAAAMRRSAVVGTKGLLAGITRAGGPDSEPDQLLRHAGYDRKRLFDELVRAARQGPIDPDVASPAPLRQPPALTPNATEIVRAAIARADPEPASPAHLFACLLEIPRSSAYAVLKELVGDRIPLELVAKAARDYLPRRATMRFADALASVAPPAARPTETVFGLSVTPSVFAAAGGGTASTPVTATALAAELLARHGEYGGGRARSVQLDPLAGESAPVAMWFDRIRALLRSQPPPLVHGRLFVVALARLDPTLRDRLSTGDLLAAIESEIREPLDSLFVAAPPPPPPQPTPAPAALALTVSARQVLTSANAMLATLPEGEPDVAAARAAVLFGALHYATTGASPNASNHLLDAVLGGASDASARLDGAAGALGMARVELTGLSPIADAALRDGPLAATLARADACRAQTGADAIHLRHLLADALSIEAPTVPSAMLTALGVGLSMLRGVLRTVVDRFVSDEPAEAWSAILAEAPDSFDLAGGLSSDAVDPTRGIKQTDDHLDVSPYVAMLAAVIADSRTPEPLSIGLFGEWGSGKSYFMGLLREQVATFAARGHPYFRHIRQIGFNAWHYADTNIWASLGDEIFEQLAGQRPSAGEERNRLREELAGRLQRRKELQAATESAQEETRRLSEELERANAERRVSAGDLARAAASSPMVKAQLDEAWKKLGVDDEVERGYLLGQEVRGTAADVDALRVVAKGPRGMVLVAVAAAAVVLLAVGIAAAPDLARWLAGGGLAVIGGLLSAALFFVRRVRSGLRTLHAASAEIAASLDEQQHVELKEQLDALRAAEAKERVLQAQHDQVVERIGELGRELTELSPGQRLYQFVTERADSDEYQRHLGVISTVRKDFEELVDLLKDWRTNGGPEGSDSIDRIVLYIDDLDRCSPQQVVEVLQAVHLLLALDLFVVVVGVDPRWLLRSLQSEYDRVLTSEREAAEDTWQASPHDYLEKIFQIPFALPRMSPRSFRVLLESFTGDRPQSRDDSGAVTGPAPEPETSVGDDGEGAEAAAVVTAARPTQRGAATQIALEPLHVEAGSEASTAASGATPIEVRPLTERELTLLASLAPLVETPREAKRLVNLYRIVRSTRNLRTATRFLGDGVQPGEYEAVVILLGLLSGHARLLERVLAATPANGVAGGLVHRDPASSWQVFASGLEPRGTDGKWKNDVLGGIDPDEVASWRQLHKGLAGATELVTLRDLEAFQFWAPQIARFSFLLSPYLHEQAGADGRAARGRAGKVRV